jgi:hypothetical protein
MGGADWFQGLYIVLMISIVWVFFVLIPLGVGLTIYAIAERTQQAPDRTAAVPSEEVSDPLV